MRACEGKYNILAQERLKFLVTLNKKAEFLILIKETAPLWNYFKSKIIEAVLQYTF